MLLFAVYAMTMAPGVTFWDAGELIAAAHVFGIPHPPGTPLFVAAGRAWSVVLASVLDVARAMNLLSAACTAMAGALGAALLSRESPSRTGWGAVTGALCAGLMLSVWANATETEVYAVALLHVVILLSVAQRTSDVGNEPTSVDEDSEAFARRGDRWMVCTAYLIALAPAVHLSVLVGAPAAIVLASRKRNGTWRLDRVVLLSGTLLASAGVGRMSWVLVSVGVAVTLSAIAVCGRRQAPHALSVILAGAIAFTAVLILLVRARHDPAVNQGNPATFSALADVVARRQYEVAALWPRQAPVWLQIANIGQYADWQFAFTWGDGIYTTPARVGVTVIFVLLAVFGVKAMRRDAPRTAESLAVLGLCGTLGVCAYLNLKAGASLGYGIVGVTAHEARDRDYFFVLGFWVWGCFAGYGAWAVVRSRNWPEVLALAAVLVPLVGNWPAADRARGEGATAAASVAEGLLDAAPARAILFVAGDNDSYPLWYMQHVEGRRLDVTVVTMPLLPADWYDAEIARRTGLHWSTGERIPGARWLHEERAALIARAGRAAARPIAASPALSRRERALLGSAWRLQRAVYVASAGADGSNAPAVIDSVRAMSRLPSSGTPRTRRTMLPDDVSEMMLTLLDCGRLARLPAGKSAVRDSLEVRCNQR